MTTKGDLRNQIALLDRERAYYARRVESVHDRAPYLRRLAEIERELSDLRDKMGKAPVV